MLCGSLLCSSSSSSSSSSNSAVASPTQFPQKLTGMWGWGEEVVGIGQVGGGGGGARR